VVLPAAKRTLLMFAGCRLSSVRSKKSNVIWYSDAGP
jgi:hypothetical protein